MDYRVGPKTGEEKTTDALVVRSEEERDGREEGGRLLLLFLFL